MTTTDQVQKYYDALIASYDILTKAIATAGDRGMKISSQLVADVTKGQREALELGKKLASDPQDVGKYFAAVMEATTAAQSRSLQFAQAAYQEAIGAGSDVKETIEKLVAANRETAEAALDFAKKWTASNPLAEQWQKGIESMMPSAKKPAAKASA